MGRVWNAAATAAAAVAAAAVAPAVAALQPVIARGHNEIGHSIKQGAAA
jgi:hypothetical protein